MSNLLKGSHTVYEAWQAKLCHNWLFSCQILDLMGKIVQKKVRKGDDDDGVDFPLLFLLAARVV